MAEQLIAAGISPLEYVLAVMRAPQPKQGKDETDGDYGRRVHAWQQQCFEAAKAALPYLHPRLQAIEHSGPEGEGIPQSITVEFV